MKNVYQVNEHDGWISAYENEPLPLDLTKIDQDLLVFEGIEMWLKTLTEEFGLNECREFFNKCLDHWLAWEKGNECPAISCDWNRYHQRNCSIGKREQSVAGFNRLGISRYCCYIRESRCYLVRAQ